MRQKRITPEETSYYHCVCRVRGQEALLDDREKRLLLALMERVAGFSGVEVKTYAILSDHFHMLIKIPCRREVDDAELMRRTRLLYGKIGADALLSRWKLWEGKGAAAKANTEKDALRHRMYNLSDFFKTLKERCSKDFNRRAGCKGTLWSERFKSILLSPDAATLATVGAYIDANPVRAGLVAKPRDYEFNGLGAAVRGNEAAREGIRELLSPEAVHASPMSSSHIAPSIKTTASGKTTASPDPVAAYESVIDGYSLEAALTSMTISATAASSKSRSRRAAFAFETKEERLAREQRAASFKSRKREFLEGAVFGTLKFVGKIAGTILLTVLECEDQIRCPWKSGESEFYNLRRVNNIHRF